MIANYFKIAIRVLLRNRFYTFISLFGISFTLLVLMLSTAYIQCEFGNNAPLTDKDKILFLPLIGMKEYERQVKENIDSTFENGQMQYDTTRVEEIIEDNFTNASNAPMNLDFLKEYIVPMKSVEKVSIYSANRSVDVYPQGMRMQFKTVYADKNYWDIHDFKFYEGRPFTQEAVENQANEIIMTKEAAKKYFGNKKSYLGEELLWGKKHMKVVGIIKKANTSTWQVNGDIFIPLFHLAKEELDFDWALFGGLQASVMVGENGSLKQVSEELRHIEKNVSVEGTGFDVLLIYEKDVADMYAWGILANQADRGGGKLLLYVFIALGLFLIIPTLNLINLNVTRIMERAAEIGVRKAFGARTRDLLIQFLFENLVITFLGGIIGLILTFGLMSYLNSAVLEDTHLEFNTMIFVSCLIITLLFGVISGLTPAWKMARTDVAVAIKQNAVGK